MLSMPRGILQTSKTFAALSSSSNWSPDLSLLQNQSNFDSNLKNPRVRLSLPEPGLKDGRSTRSERSRAVCFLVGWIGSKPKTMAKYASLYTDMGVPCIALAPSMPNFWFNFSGNKISEDAWSVLESLHSGSTNQPHEPPLSLILHLFSGGGYVLFPKLLDYWSNSDSILRTDVIPKCVIFDSGPSNFSYQSGLNASKLLYMQGALNVVSYSIARAIGVITNLLIGSQKRAVLRSALDSDLMNIPQLYLHSKIDTVATYGWVSSIIQEQRERGRKVSSHCWNETQHLRLYLEHKEEYTRHVEEFLKECRVLKS